VTARDAHWTEAEAIALLGRLFARERGGRGIELAIGDDAAVVRVGGARVVWTVDTQVEGVHFDRRWLDLSDLGWRSFQAAASDLAAMGARPIGALSSLILPAGSTARELSAIGKGQAEAASALRCPVVGGNIARGSELSVTSTLIGRAAEAPLLRSGARAGHEVWLIGAVGLARAGLELLSRGLPLSTAALRACARAWRRPEALVARGAALLGRASSLIDVSDGLAGDLAHVATASEARAVIEHAALRRALPAELVVASAKLGEDPLELALYGGEDYALLATGRGARRPRFARRIGRIERGRGTLLEMAAGRAEPLGGGYDHLR
jgi:thiamine-monophosphate kinase